MSIEAQGSPTTGISAHDRARMIAVAVDPTKGVDDIVTPGHVFLLGGQGTAAFWCARTQPQARGLVHISRMAGLNPAAMARRRG